MSIPATSSKPTILDLRGLSESDRDARINEAICGSQGWERLPDPSEPECPDCGFKVGRPKCAFEYGAACPRHKVAREWKQRLKRKAWKTPDDEILTPPYVTSSDAVMPLLGKTWCSVADSRGKIGVTVTNRGLLASGESETFPLAACIALLRAHGIEVIF